MGVDGWTVVFTGGRVQADVVASALSAHGIEVQVYGDFGFGTGSGFDYGNPSGVMVPDGQVKAARKFIREAGSSR